jgi:signal transduction histidine kinase
MTQSEAPSLVAGDARPEPAPGRAATRAAWSVAGLATLASLAAVALPLLVGGDWLPDLFRTPEPVIAPSFGIAGAVVVAAGAAGRRLGWLLLAVAMSAGAYVLATSVRALVDAPAGAIDWARAWVWLPGLLLTTAVLPHVVPYGRSLGGRWRVLASGALIFSVAATAAVAILAGTGIRVDPFSSPWFTIPLAIFVVSGVVSIVVRLRRGGPVQRRQLAWVGYGLVVGVVATFTAPPWLVAIAVLALPIGLAVAATRYRLFDIEIVVDRTLVAVVLLAITAVAYAGVAGWAGALVGAGSPVAGFIAAFTVALVFHPLYQRVQRVVSRVLRGRRPDPAELQDRVARAVREGVGPQEALRAGVAEVVRALRARSAVVETRMPDGAVFTLGEGQPSADAGAEADAVRMPLRLHGEEIGTLSLLPGEPADAFSPTDRRLLDRMGSELAPAAYALRLASALDVSRTALLTAREDERRRLRRDLHDGLGPQLAAAVMTLDTAASALTKQDPERARTLVSAGRADVGEAIRDVRRLVEGLRPPALDDLGLVGALRAGAAALQGRPADPGSGADQDGAPVPAIRIESGDLPTLPAAVEVAALRIAQEAVLNAVRHADAGKVRVGLRAERGRLIVEVADDGTGIPEGARHGVGLGSMRERAAELGGSCTISPAGMVGRHARPGTLVHAELPLEALR